MTDIKNLDDIKVVVDTFYKRIQEDELLGPVFALRIAADGWEKHLNRMYIFWNTVLFNQKGYKGNPFPKHAKLPVEEQHFKHWVELFHQTVDELYEGVVADDAKLSATRMGEMFWAKLSYLRSNPQQISIM